VIVPTQKSHSPNIWRHRSVIMHWIQFTNIGIEVFGCIQGIYCWVTDLITGAAIKGAKIQWGVRSHHISSFS